MKQPTRFYPRLEVDTAPCASVAQAGRVMLTETIAVSGLAGHLRSALAPWRRDLAVHDPAKVLLDLALTEAKGSAGGRPPAFDPELYSNRNTVERGFNRLKHWRGIATRYDKYALAYLGGVTLAAIVIHHRVRS